MGKERQKVIEKYLIEKGISEKKSKEIIKKNPKLYFKSEVDKIIDEL